MGSIPWSRNLPLDQLQLDSSMEKHFSTETNVVFICRRGNDSQRAAAALTKYCARAGREMVVKDVIGGLHAWSRLVDPSFPVY